MRPPVERDRAGEGGRNTLSGGQSLIARLATILVREGGTIRTNLPVTGLVTDDDGTASSASPRCHRRARSRSAPRRGVLLAAGGFEGNEAMRRDHGVPGDTAWTMAPRGTNTGEPIEARASRSAPPPTSAPLGWFCPGLEQPDGGGSFTLGFRSGLMVDQTGRRYANECLPYDRFGREMAKAPERIPSWYVFDSREDGRLPAIAMPEGDPAAHLAAGTWVTRRHHRRAGRGGRTAAGRARRDGRAVQRLRRGRRRRGLRAAARTSTTRSSPAATAPNKALTPLDAAAVLRRPLRALRPRHQGRPGHRRRRPGAARGRHRRSRGCTPPATPRRRSSGRSTRAPAPRSARRWSSPRSRWRTCPCRAQRPGCQAGSRDERVGPLLRELPVRGVDPDAVGAAVVLDQPAATGPLLQERQVHRGAGSSMVTSEHERKVVTQENRPRAVDRLHRPGQRAARDAVDGPGCRAPRASC